MTRPSSGSSPVISQVPWVAGAVAVNGAGMAAAASGCPVAAAATSESASYTSIADDAQLAPVRQPDSVSCRAALTIVDPAGIDDKSSLRLDPQLWLPS